MEQKAVIAALATAIVSAVGLELYLRAFEARALGGDPRVVLIASRDIAVGEVLAKDMLASRPLPEAYASSRNLLASDQARVVGIRLTVAQKAGEPLLWSDLAGKSSRALTLSESVRAGMRAFTLRSEGGTFAGLLDPGDRVDVLAAVGAGSYTTLAENVLVLAVGARTRTRTPEDHDTTRGAERSEVTVSVTPEQAHTLARVTTARFALRNPADAWVSQPPREETPR